MRARLLLMRAVVMAGVATGIGAALVASPPGIARAEVGTVSIETSVAAQGSPTRTGEAIGLSEVTMVPAVRLGYGVTESVHVYLGYRGVTPEGPRNYAHGDVAFSGNALLLGARWYQDIAGRWLKFYAQAELEAMHGELKMSLGGLTGVGGAWAPGIVPEVGLDARWQIAERFAITARLGVGYALRMNLDFNTVSFGQAQTTIAQTTTVTTTGGSAAAVDLGKANISGLTWGLSFGLAF